MSPAETAIIRENRGASRLKCVIYVWDWNISGFVAAFSSREIDAKGQKKEKRNTRTVGRLPVT